jgi:hypothetical protein
VSDTVIDFMYIILSNSHNLRVKLLLCSFLGEETEALEFKTCPGLLLVM